MKKQPNIDGELLKLKKKKKRKAGKDKKNGRPPKYDPHYAQAIIDYFDVEPIIFKDVKITNKDGSTKEMTVEEASPLPFLSGFAKEIGVCTDTLLTWSKDHEEFSVAYKKAKQLQTQFIMINGLRGNFNPVFSIFTLKNVAKWRDEDDQNWGDKLEVEVGKKMVKMDL